MTLAQIVWKKEITHWKRMGRMWTEFKGVTKVIGWVFILLIIIVHYAYVFMSVWWESMLYLFNRKMFKANIQKLALSV